MKIINIAFIILQTALVTALVYWMVKVSKMPFVEHKKALLALDTFAVIVNAVGVIRACIELIGM